MKKYRTHIIWLVIAIAAFAGGMYYANATASATAFSGARNQGSFASSTRGAFGARGNGGGFVSGQVITKDAQSITVQLPNGNSAIVFYSSSTQVMKPAAASIADLVPGTEISVGGTENADGSMTAQSIQVRNGTSTAR